MNPLVIVGIMALTISSAVLMISFANDQVQYSETVQDTANLQSQRVQEKVSIAIQGDDLEIKNIGTVPVWIKEIRVLDDDGNIILRQKIDKSISTFQIDILDTNNAIDDAIKRINANQNART